MQLTGEASRPDWALFRGRDKKETELVCLWIQAHTASRSRPELKQSKSAEDEQV